jgi:hypothetical protein
MPSMPKDVKLDLKIWLALKNRLPDIAEARVRVGVLADKGGAAIVPGTSLNMVALAAIHEFGSPAARIPERSFIRSTFEQPDVVRRIRALALRGAKKLLAEGPLRMNELELALGAIGAFAAGAIRKTVKMRMTVGPEDQRLRPSTVAKRMATPHMQRIIKRLAKQGKAPGDPVPLLDTGRLLNAVSWLVVRDGGKS